MSRLTSCPSSTEVTFSLSSPRVSRFFLGGLCTWRSFVRDSYVHVRAFNAVPSLDGSDLVLLGQLCVQRQDTIPRLLRTAPLALPQRPTAVASRSLGCEPLSFRPLTENLCEHLGLQRRRGFSSSSTCFNRRRTCEASQRQTAAVSSPVVSRPLVVSP